jgi:hypothetical protein
VTPGVNIGETVVSLPVAKGFRISENITLARPDVIIRGRKLRTYTQTAVCMRLFHPNWRLRPSIPYGPSTIPGPMRDQAGKGL